MKMKSPLSTLRLTSVRAGRGAGTAAKRDKFDGVDSNRTAEFSAICSARTSGKSSRRDASRGPIFLPLDARCIV